MFTQINLNVNMDGCAGLMLIYTYSFKHTHHTNDTNVPFTLITYKPKYVLSRNTFLWYKVILSLILNHIRV